MKPKVSVIIPTYNRSSMLIECIESVLKQTYKNFEIIVIDDGSTDNTKEVLKPYKDKITYVRQENQGAAAARNRGIKEAKGEYIAFLDSDDMWLPDKLEKQMRFLSKHPEYDMVCGNGVSFGNKEKEGKPVISRKRIVIVEREGLTLKNNYIKGYIYPSAMVVKKSVIEEIGMFDTDLKTCEDRDLCLRFLLKYKAAFINEPLFRRRRHSENISANTKQIHLDMIKITEKLISNYPETIRIIGKKCIQKELASRYYKLGLIYSKNKEKHLAIDAFKKALSYKMFYPSCLMSLFFNLMK